MKRIAIIGSGGSGKTTLSLLLGEKLNLPVYHLDKLYWKPGWKEPHKEQWKEIVKNLCQNECWIIDGNYKSTLDVRLEACDTAILLDVNRIKCIYRVTKRALTTNSRPDMADGCEEKIDLEFLKFLWSYPNQTPPIVVNMLNGISHKKRVIISKSVYQALQTCISEK